MTNWQQLTAAQKQEAVREALEVAGLSYAQAAAALGATSRMAIAGVVDRSKRTANPIRSPDTPGKPMKDKPVKAARQRNATQIIQEKARRARATAKGADDDPVIAPVGDGRPIYSYAWDPLPGTSPVALEHHRGACRWPIKVPGAIDRACNEPTDGGRYCAHHHALGVRAEAPSPAKRTTAGKIKAFNL